MRAVRLADGMVGLVAIADQGNGRSLVLTRAGAMSASRHADWETRSVKTFEPAATPVAPAPLARQPAAQPGPTDEHARRGDILRLTLEHAAGLLVTDPSPEALAPLAVIRYALAVDDLINATKEKS